MGFPSNIADAASAIRDGVFGLIKIAKIGDVSLASLTGLETPSELSVTRRPVEAGYEATTMAIEIPREVHMGIVLANPDFSLEAGLDAVMSGGISGFLDTWRDKKAYLHQLQLDRELVEVQTHEGVYDSMLVQLIDPLYDTANNADAFIANITMVHVKVIQTGLGGLVDQAQEAAGGL